MPKQEREGGKLRRSRWGHANRVFGETLRRKREAAGLSQDDIADLADFDRSYISQLERGLRSPLVAILAIAEALNCPPIEFIQEIEAKTKKAT